VAPQIKMAESDVDDKFAVGPIATRLFTTYNL